MTVFGQTDCYCVLVRVNERPGSHPFLAEANSTGIYPPLGVAYLAAAAQKAGHPVRIIDAHAMNYSNLQIAEKIARIDAKVVGISTTTFNWPVAVDLARTIRSNMPELKVIVGGPQLSIYPEQSLAESAFDGGIVGEGEGALVEILDCYKKGESPSGIPGTIFREEGELIAGPQRSVEKNLDSLPMPALDLLPLHRYRALTLPNRFVTMVTSRGCPYLCRYCSQVYVGGKYREHSAGRILDEVERAVKHFGAKEIVFFDETFAVNKQRVFEVCDGILHRGIHVAWNIRTRVDILDETMLKAMRRAGCRSLHVGVESGSPRVQKLMKKNLDLNRMTHSLNLAKQMGMETRGYFMIGFPGETLDEIESTIRLSTELPLDWASFTITTPHPATDIYHEGMKEGRFGGDYWEKYTLGQVHSPPGYFTCEQYDQKKLEELLKAAYQKFYLRPQIIVSKILRPRLWKELPDIVRTIMSL